MSETAAILAQMVDRLFTDHVDAALLAAAAQGRWPSELWRLAEEQGLTTALVPEARGGMGASFHEVCVIARACGRHRVPVPLPETIAAGWLLASAGLDVPEGPLSLGGAHRDDDVRLTQAGTEWRLSGAAHRVPWGRMAGSLVLAVEQTDAMLIVRAPCAGCTIEHGNNVAGECRDTLRFTDHPVEVGSWPTVAGNPVLMIGALMRSGQIAGALADILERSVSYANDRKQFGRAIGKQQVIQQYLAVLAAEAAAVDVAAEAAFIAADAGNAEFLVAAAKTRAGTAVALAVGIAHQVHGAIGFALEHPLHWSTRRLMAWRGEFGSDRHWAVVLGRKILDLGADGFWPALTAV
jgi:acyl-CoA dehydrogenase